MAAIRDEKIINENSERLNELFRYCFLMVGLREKNFPNELETLFLHEFIKENYGGHTISEVRMAFKMAINDDLDIDRDRVVCYENFSVLYLSDILNSYRRWSKQAFAVIEKQVPNPDEEKYYEGARQDVHWGYYIEKEYQHFLSFGEDHWKLFPVAFYDQLVKDQVVSEDLFRKAMKIVRRKLIGELQRERTKMQMRNFDQDHENEAVRTAELINSNNILDLNRKINAYGQGVKDSEIEVVAKQYCVLQFFKNSKESLNQHVYVPSEE